MKTRAKQIKISLGGVTLMALLGSLPAIAQQASPEKPVVELVDARALPSIQVPQGYEEGYLPKLSEIDIKEVEQFAKNSSADLNDLLELVSKVPDYWEKRTMLKNGIDAIIQKSKPLKTELLMRNVLERAVIMTGLIDAEVQNDLKRKGVIDQEVRLMKESIRLALKYWEPYLKHVNGQTTTANVDLAKINYRDFGVSYANLLWSVANSIFDASAEYKLRLESLKLLMWDLYRDENKLESGQAGAITKLYTLAKNAPDPTNWTDDDYVEHVKLLRIVRNEAFKRLGPEPGMSPVERARVAEAARVEAARAAEIAKTQPPKPTQYDLDAYRKTFNHYTSSCSAIGDGQAQVVARQSAAGELAVGVFIDAYDRTCSVSTATQVATGVKKGEVDQSAFQATNGHYTSTCSSISSTQALEIAKLVAQGKMNVKDFLDLYDRNCSFSSAKLLATTK